MPRIGRTATQAGQLGFSLIEVLVSMGMFLVISALAIPNSMRVLQSYRATADARNIASQLALAKMRAASDFTQTELDCNLGANSCQLEVCTTKGTTSCTTWSAEGGAVLLSPGDSFGFGAITAPAGTQTTIQNATPILFNSRGIPIDSTGAPTGDEALYLTDPGGHTYAVTVNASGQVRVWQYLGNSWSGL